MLHRQRFALKVVHDATRCADNYLRSGTETHELPFVARAAVHRQFAHAFFECGEARNLLGHLHRELAGGA